MMKSFNENVGEVISFIKKAGQEKGITKVRANLEALRKICATRGVETVKVYVAGSDLPNAEIAFILSILAKIQELEIDWRTICIFLRGINGILRYC